MGKKTDVLGIDVGFGFTKASNGNEFVMFKSILGETTDIQFRSDIGDNSFSNSIHVTINDQSYFVGDFAEQQSNVRQFTLDQDRLINEFLKTLVLTVAGRFSEQEMPINIVSGLPVGYFKQNNKRFSQILLGHHNISYHKSDGSAVIKKVFVNKIRMMPQPLGSFFNLLMDNNGKIVNRDLTNQKVGIVDIGFRTTDFTIFDKLRYVERGSSTIDGGISKCFSIIATKLREKSGIAVELYRLYDAVKTGSIKMKGQEYDISKIRDQVYAQSAEIIGGDIDRLWNEDWDIDTIVLTGGGSQVLARYLKPLVSGNVIPLENGVDTRLNNVQGYLKYGKYIWGGSGTCAPPSSIPAK